MKYFLKIHYFIFFRSGQDYITIGGTEISYNNSFRLYMTTSKANPHFLPAVCIAVTIINFGITFEGLQVISIC